MTMMQLQKERLQHEVYLSKSVRRDKLEHAKVSLPPEQAAQEALRIASNADYFSSHLSFVRRLGDVAEKLRHLDVQVRGETLERELALLNSSGSMGGDPLNWIQTNLTRVVRVPQKEGHVFRSKERTPVLLLMEVVEEGRNDENVKSNTDTNSKDGEVDGNDSDSSDSDSESEQAKGEGTGEDQSNDQETGDSLSEETPEEAHETAKSEENDGDSKVNSHGTGVNAKDNGSGGEEMNDNTKTKKLTVSTEDKDIYSDPLKTLDEEFMESHHHSPRGIIDILLMYLFFLTYYPCLHSTLCSPWQTQAL
jgi:hypothetical protein